MSKARNIADLLDATGDVVSSALDNVPPSDNASSLTTGTLPVARLADGSITNAKLNNDAKVVKSASAPSSPVEGDLWYDTANEVLKIYSNTDSSFVKVVRVTPTLDSISGDVVTTIAGNLTLTGTGFLTSNLQVSFTPSGGSASTVTVTPTNDTTATVAVPSAIYNQSASTVISITVQNSDLKTSNSSSKTVVDLPTGGTISNSGGYRIHTFTSSGTFTNSISNLSVEYLVVAGGGSGGIQHSGGGGAGGFRTNVSGASSGGGASAESSLSVATGSYTVTVGAGGAKNTSLGNANGTRGNNGNDTTIYFPTAITSIGGGRAGRYNGLDGDDGGSGGGAPTDSGSAGAGTANQGFAGGASGGQHGSPGGGGGGGGGAGSAGVGGNGSTGDGGIGVQSSIDGTTYYYAGGGGGARVHPGGLNGSRAGNGGNGGGGGGGDGSNSSAVGGTGGSGRNSGGNGGNASVTNANSFGGDGGANTGGGGGGSGRWEAVAGSGGSGIAIIRYAI